MTWELTDSDKDAIKTVSIVLGLVVLAAALLFIGAWWNETNTMCHNEVVKEKQITDFEYLLVTDITVRSTTKDMYAVASIGDGIGVCVSPLYPEGEVRSIEKVRPVATGGEGGWSWDYEYPCTSDSVCKV